MGKGGVDRRRAKTTAPASRRRVIGSLSPRDKDAYHRTQRAKVARDVCLRVGWARRAAYDSIDGQGLSTCDAQNEQVFAFGARSERVDFSEREEEGHAIYLADR